VRGSGRARIQLTCNGCSRSSRRSTRPSAPTIHPELEEQESDLQRASLPPRTRSSGRSFGGRACTCRRRLERVSVVVAYPRASSSFGDFCRARLHRIAAALARWSSGPDSRSGRGWARDRPGGLASTASTRDRTRASAGWHVRRGLRGDADLRRHDAPNERVLAAVGGVRASGAYVPRRCRPSANGARNQPEGSR
jgi:hypothetical protein